MTKYKTRGRDITKEVLGASITLRNALDYGYITSPIREFRVVSKSNQIEEFQKVKDHFIDRLIGHWRENYIPCSLRCSFERHDGEQKTSDAAPLFLWMKLRSRKEIDAEFVKWVDDFLRCPKSSILFGEELCLVR